MYYPRKMLLPYDLRKNLRKSSNLRNGPLAKIFFAKFGQIRPDVCEDLRRMRRNRVDRTDPKALCPGNVFSRSEIEFRVLRWGSVPTLKQRSGCTCPGKNCIFEFRVSSFIFQYSCTPMLPPYRRMNEHNGN